MDLVARENDLRQLARDLLAPRLRKETDFRVFLHDTELQAFAIKAGHSDLSDWWYQYCRLQGRQDAEVPRITSFDLSVVVPVPVVDAGVDKTVQADARLQVSRCGNDAHWSVTVRWDPPKGLALSAAAEDGEISQQAFLGLSPWRPADTYGGDASWSHLADKKPPFLYSIDDLVKATYGLVFKANERHDGLILLTGSTNAAKSNVARGLIWEHLNALSSLKRRLHLVTYEDPIEKPFQASFSERAAPSIDYTQRAARVDCRSLQEACDAALRQTPDVFYMGEIRRDCEMRQTVEFAGRGHLIVATAHAGSLIEGVARLLKAAEHGRLGTRAFYVPNILAVAHLASLSVSASFCGTKRSFFGIVPALYRRTPRGVQNLIADGLASLLPHFTNDRDVAGFGSLGRQVLVRELAALQMPRVSEQNRELWKAFQRWHAAEPNTAFSGERLIDVALREDLNGH
jgi:hypothetical protein